MSEFPALTSRSLSLDVDTGASYRQNSEFVIQKEDFPALSAFGSQQQPLTSNEKAMSTTNDAMLQETSPRPPTTMRRSGNFQANNLNSFPTLSEAKQGNGASDRQDEHPKFGLIGMLQFMRPNDSERTLVHGYDLTSLGMNLNSSECVALLLLVYDCPFTLTLVFTLISFSHTNSCFLESDGLDSSADASVHHICRDRCSCLSLHQTFASPWADGPSTKEPQFNLPACYYNQPPVLKTTHLSKFQLETLFFVFYAMPKDVVQAYAAQELYIREWRYHVELKLWFKRQPNEGSGVAQFIYFDINTWERRLFGGNTSGVSAGFMGEDDIRVKFSNSA
ncbi:hypothetical protein AaE_007279 [Aphanomyces astaci]|uniref:NOT2/NOT3/NOT5 C-terminal domain-containing protein n=1 Tax=Aphanomyces astaci TaxID=112090 RepID=A0A6A5A2V4_APHAT|nr:hypothetical protein AaE_007279 [Aphanomyces astaci]